MRHHLLAIACAIILPASAHAKPRADGATWEPVACPEFMRDTTLSLTETPGGSLLTITTPHDANVPMMRVAVRQTARFIERSTTRLSRMRSIIPLVIVATKYIEGGVELTVRARRQTDLPILRAQSRLVETRWKRSSCQGVPQLPPGTVSA